MPLLLSEGGTLELPPGLVFWSIVTLLLGVFVVGRLLRRAPPSQEVSLPAVGHPPAGNDGRSEAEKRLAEHQAAIAAYRHEAFAPLPKDAPAGPRGRAVASKKA